MKMDVEIVDVIMTPNSIEFHYLADGIEYAQVRKLTHLEVEQYLEDEGEIAIPSIQYHGDEDYIPEIDGFQSLCDWWYGTEIIEREKTILNYIKSQK